MKRIVCPNGSNSTDFYCNLHASVMSLEHKVLLSLCCLCKWRRYCLFFACHVFPINLLCCRFYRSRNFRPVYAQLVPLYPLVCPWGNNDHSYQIGEGGCHRQVEHAKGCELVTSSPDCPIIYYESHPRTTIQEDFCPLVSALQMQRNKADPDAVFCL